MQYKRFVIREYRAIDSATIAVGNRLIPLIGVNESGKTSILKAILCFDRESDKQNGREHLEYQNNYKTTDHNCSITAEIVIDPKTDLDSVVAELGLKEGDGLIDELREVATSKRPVSLTRDLASDRRPYSVSGFEASPKVHRKLARALYDRLPFILYFDDFTDRVPDKIEFAVTDSDAGYKVVNTKLLGWQEIISEVFNRATDGEHDIKSFLAITDEDRQSGVLSDINDHLENKVMEDWRRLKRRGTALADDSKDLELTLYFQRTSVERFMFRFRVSDRARQKKRFFNVSERSKGFQWYFNFLMKLNFNPKYKGHQSDAIYLLDEPGSYLHDSAQIELLQELRDISGTNTILYCTHSQHLLDSDVINIGQTRIAEKEGGKIQIIPFGSYPLTKNQGALSPLLRALRLKTGVLDYNTKSALITEGIIDFYFFTMLIRYRDDWEFEDLSIIPGAGAGHLKDLISLAIANTRQYLVILDSDEEGRKAYDKYVDFFDSGESHNITMYTTPSADTNVTLEKLLGEEDRKRIMQLTEATNIKSAIIALYYADNCSERESCIRSLSDETLGNLSIVKDILDNHFKD